MIVPQPKAEMPNAGASDAILMQLGGWTRPDQIRRYASAVSGRMREAANAIAKGLQHEHRQHL